MTVAELIEHLRRIEPDRVVYRATDGGDDLVPVDLVQAYENPFDGADTARVMLW
jgi:hypothetical protein